MERKMLRNVVKHGGENRSREGDEEILKGYRKDDGKKEEGSSGVHQE